MKCELGSREDLTIQTSASKGSCSGQYQSGGTCTGATGQWASRVVSNYEDPDRLGRWSCVRMQVKGIVISFVTAYRMCKTKVSLETNTAYAQQWKELTAASSRKVDPRQKTLVDPKKFISKEMECKREFVLLIDANESAEKRSEEMSALIQGCGLVDGHLLSDLYSEVENYARGNGKIDYILVSPRIQISVKYTHICPYNEWLVSYHRALVVDLDYQVLEKGELEYWQRTERSFHTNSAEKVHQGMSETKD